MIELFNIEKACRSQGGVRDVFIFDPSNIDSIPIGDPGGVNTSDVTFVDDDKVHHIRFTRETSNLSIQEKDSRAGQFFDIEITGFVPRPRLEVEILIKMLMNHRHNAIVTDNNGLQRYCWNMLLSVDLGSGKRRSDLNGYTMKWTGKSDQSLPIISGEIVTSTQSGSVTFVGSGGGGGECVKINPLRVGYIPSASGNTEHLCHFVRASDDTLWYIDPDGRGVSFNESPTDYNFTEIAKGPIIKSPDGSMWRIKVTNYGAFQAEKI